MPKKIEDLPEEMGKGRKSAGGHWPFQRRECGSLRKGRRRADDRDGCPDFSSFYTQVRSSLAALNRGALPVPMSSRRTGCETRYSRYQDSPFLRHTATR